MVANSSCPALPPNPLTPLAWLPPELANQYDIARSLYPVTLGIYTWDVFVNLSADYKLLVKSKVGVATLIYYLSRISTFCYIASNFFIEAVPITHCPGLQIATGISYVATVSFTSLLFFLRLRAVYFMETSIQVIFGVLWLGTLGSTITVPVGISFAHIGPTKYCINTRVTNYTVGAAIGPLINDSAVFLAISYRVISFQMAEETFQARVKAFVSAGSTVSGRLSRTLLSSGQLYYFIATCGNILLVIMNGDQRVLPLTVGACTVPVLAIINLLACIVFRKVKFGLILEDGTTHKSTTMDVRSGLHCNPGRRGGRSYGETEINPDTSVHPLSNLSKIVRREKPAPSASGVVVMKESDHSN